MNSQHPINTLSTLSTSRNNLLPLLPITPSVAPVNSPNPEETISNVPILKTLEPSIPALENNEQVSEASAISQPCIVPKIEKAEIVFIIGPAWFTKNDIADLKSIAKQEGISVDFFINEDGSLLLRDNFRKEYPQKVANGATILLFGHSMLQSEEELKKDLPLRLKVFQSKKPFQSEPPSPYIGNRSFKVLGETMASQVIVGSCLGSRGIHKQNKWGEKPVIFYGRHDEEISIAISKDISISYMRDFGQRKRHQMSSRTFEETFSWWALHSTLTITAHQPDKEPCISEVPMSLESIIGVGLREKMENLAAAVKEKNAILAQALKTEAATVPLKGFGGAIKEFRILSTCFRAILKNDLETVQSLLEQFPHAIHLQASNGHTLLMLACCSGRLNIVQFLLGKIEKMDEKLELIYKKDKFGFTALMNAAQEGYKDIVELFLKLNEACLVNEKNIQGATALMLACKEGRVDAAKLLMDHPSCSLNDKEMFGNTALMCASKNGAEGIVKLFLDNDACAVNAKGKDGSTALMLACSKGYIDIVRLFVDNPRCSIGEKNVNGVTALMVTCFKGYKEIVELLLAAPSSAKTINEKDKDGHSALSIAFSIGYLEIVKILLNHKECYRHIHNTEGNTLLMLACMKGYSEIVALLLEKEGLDNRKNKDGNTALTVACMEGRVRIAQLLIDKIEKMENPISFINEPGSNGSPAIIKGYKHKEIVERLFSLGADVNVINKFGGTLLMYVACIKEYEETEILTKILHNTKDLDNRNEDGDTALTFASQYGNTKIIKQLLERANPNICNNASFSPLMIACQAGHDETAKLLLESGAKTGFVDSNGNNALMLAEKNGHQNIVALLKVRLTSH